MYLLGSIFPYQDYILPVLTDTPVEVKRLDPTTFYQRFFYPYFFTQLFTAFTFSFSRDGSYFPHNQNYKDKRL